LVVADDDADEGASGLVPLEPSDDDVAGELEGLVCPQLPLGLYQLSDPSEGRPMLPWLPESVQQEEEVGGGGCLPGLRKGMHCMPQFLLVPAACVPPLSLLCPIPGGATCMLRHSLPFP
jgi:hypothetical protein